MFNVSRLSVVGGVPGIHDGELDMDTMILAALLAGIAVGFMMGWFVHAPAKRYYPRRSLSSWIRMRYPRTFL